MVSSGKSRTTGWTRAEYDRPVSLRSLASWIPARKSWASRIIGDLAVRPIAVSTSRSIEASVPSTISRVTGSTPLTAPPESRSGCRTGRPRPGTRAGAAPWPRTPPPPPARRRAHLGPDPHGDKSLYRQIHEPGRSRRPGWWWWGWGPHHPGGGDEARPGAPPRPPRSGGAGWGGGW